MKVSVSFTFTTSIKTNLPLDMIEDMLARQLRSSYVIVLLPRYGDLATQVMDQIGADPDIAVHLLPDGVKNVV